MFGGPELIEDTYILPHAFINGNIPVKGRFIKKALASYVENNIGEACSSDMEGTCDITSRDLRSFLLDWDIPSILRKLTRPSQVPYPITIRRWDRFEHYIVKVGIWNIDMTARQFNPVLPIPVVWRG